MNIESYPPLFRDQAHRVLRYDPVLVPERKQNDGDSIPTIDLQSLDPKNLEDACKQWGLFRLVNHGVPPLLLTQLQEHVKNLFSLSFKHKQNILGSPLSYFWGTPVLTPSGSALGHQTFHWVEGLNAPLGQLSQFTTQDPLLDSFRNVLLEYGLELTRITKLIFGAMAENLGLEPVQRDTYLSDATGLIRAYRYPCDSRESSNKCGMEAHTDSSVLTILLQDLVGGLEVLRQGDWVAVEPVPGSLIINLGDMLQAMSDDEYKSVVHRVRINSSKDRVSIGYFVFPKEGSIIQSGKYRPFTYSEFQATVQQDIKTVGYKVGLKRFMNNVASDVLEEDQQKFCE